MKKRHGVGACFWALGNWRQLVKYMESGAVASCTCVSVAESVWSKCMASDRAVFILSVFLYLPGVSGVST